MKALKKASVSASIVFTLAAVVNGFYNTAEVNDKSFLTASYGIKFEKRLDEIQGHVTIGRNAASVTEGKWNKLNVSKRENVQAVAIEKSESGMQENLAINETQPAILESMELSLSNVFYNRPLEAGEFSGSARTSGGVVEEVYVNLPDGNSIEINTREPMSGNVFHYEDPITRETKSAMFYEVKKGVYMVTLTNDDKYAGVRMEFTAQNNAEFAYSEEYYEDTRSWDMNSQNYQEQAVENNYVDPYEQLLREDELRQQAQPQNSFGFQFES